MPQQADMFFDAHLDLAYLTEVGRDMHAPLDDCRGRLLPAAVTLPSLRDGNVHACLGTIFTEALATDATNTSTPTTDTPEAAYPEGDALAAWRAGMRQLKLYQAWAQAGVIELMPRRPQGTHANTDAPPARDDEAASVATPARDTDAPLLLGILMECADPIETPDQLDEWANAGVIAIGMAWWRGSRYAGGNGLGGPLTDAGRDLADRMDDLGIVHDLSHLSQHATDELLAHTDRVVVASHSNCRALLDGEANPDWQRHLSDETIAEIGRRGGIVGLNLVRNFIRSGLKRDDPDDRPTIDETLAHVEHVCDIMGHRRGVGLGTDMDGGITANDLPRGINSPSDLHKLCDALTTRGWSDAEVRGFAWGNWTRFWGVE
ncbi:MAG: membrane dipeptidase [Planctomycetota bacterium]|nr:membrane dipeptidase [Planctomycetota bacterium]